MSNTTTHAVLVRILVDRYEDTGDGYNTAAEALASSRAYLESLIAKPAVDVRKDGTVDRSLAAMADRFDIIDTSVEDNGEECDGEDIGRWTIGFEIIARFLVDATSRKAAEAKIIKDIEVVIEDVICDSVEEYACNFSADLLRKHTN